MANVKVQVDQLSPDVLTEGNLEYLKQTTLGQLFTADWHQRLILAGYVYTLDLGDIGATSWTALTGNAAVDLDQPEIVIAVDSGWLVPMSIDIGIVVNDVDAYDDITQIGFYADRSQATAAGATATVETPNNLLDGGVAFGGRAFSIVTADITDPVMSDYLGGKYWELTQVATETGGSVNNDFTYLKIFPFPNLLAGPCQIIGYVTGTNTPTFMGSVTFAHIPASAIKTV